MRTRVGIIGLSVLAGVSLPAQVCYQFSGVQAANSPSSFSSFVVRVNIANPKAVVSIGGILEGGFTGPDSSFSVTIDQTTRMPEEFQASIIYNGGSATTFSLAGGNLGSFETQILLMGSGNLLPSGLPPSLPPLSSWDGGATFFLGTNSTGYMGRVTSIGSCGSVVPAVSPPPSITSGGIVPVFSTAGTVESGEWVSIYGANLATSTATWNGDFPVSLGGTSVTVDGKPAYLWLVSPNQINLQVPDDPATGTVPVVVTTPSGSAVSTVTLSQFAPSFSLLDARHVTGIIARSGGSGAYGGGTYDIIGPTGTSLGYRTVAAKPGDIVTLFAVGLGPTNPHVPGGQPFSGSAPTTNPVTVLINNASVTPSYSGETSAGLYQLNLTIPPNPGSGDVPLQAIVGGSQTQAGVVIALDAPGSAVPNIQDVKLGALVAGSGASVTGTVDLSAPAPAGGLIVVLSSSGGVSLPPSVSIAAGSTAATFNVTTQTVATAQTVIVTATYAGISVQTALTVSPATAGSLFVQLIVIPAFHPTGYETLVPSIAVEIYPDPGNNTFTACIDGCGAGTVFLGGTASNQGQTFTFNTVRAGANNILFAGSSSQLLQVSSGSLTFTAAKTVSSGKIVLGNVTGTLSLTGSTPQNPSVTLSGAITGNYSEILP